MPREVSPSSLPLYAPPSSRNVTSRQYKRLHRNTIPSHHGGREGWGQDFPPAASVMTPLLRPPTRRNKTSSSIPLQRDEGSDKLGDSDSLLRCARFRMTSAGESDSSVARPWDLLPQNGHSTHFVLLFLKQLVSDEGFRDTCQKGI